MTKIILLYRTTIGDTDCEDLIDDKKMTRVTVSTLENLLEQGEVEARKGIYLSSDGIYDIIVNDNIINHQILKKAVRALSYYRRKEDVRYKLVDR